jgi:ABC-2 type transport system ATP-binding protein
MDAPFLELDGLVRRFGERAAVDGLSVKIGRGGVFGFLGPNGAGKTTTFHLLTGLLHADAGRILLEGRPATPTDPRMRQRLGVVFQEPSLDDKLTGLENLRLGAALYGLSAKTAEARITELLQLVELGDRARDSVAEYSGGMKRRLEVARVLLPHPEILIMDEPSRGIDQATQRRIWTQLLDWRRRRRLTILLTTHVPDEAEYCDRLAVLDHGKVIALDTPESLRGRVGGDVIVLEGDAPDELALEVARVISMEARVVDGKVVVEAPRGHELIPRIVEALPQRRLSAVGMRRPTLADAFVHLTGRGLA